MEAVQSIRVLLVEDSETDALLLEEHLRSEGLEVDLTRVMTLELLRSALTQPGWDLLLTDFNLPGLDGLQVVREGNRLVPELPCIVVSGAIGEDAAVEALRAGAKDFVTKHRLARLLPAIHREVAEARERGAAKRAFRTSEAEFRTLFDQAPLGIALVDAQSGQFCEVNPVFAAIAGLDLAALGQLDWRSLLGEPGAGQDCPAPANGAHTSRVDRRILRPDGSVAWIRMSLVPVKVEAIDQDRRLCMIEDITEQRDMEREQLEQLQFLSTLIETLPTPFYHEDAEGCIQGSNHAFQAFLGLPSSQLHGRRTSEVLGCALANAAQSAQGPGQAGRDVALRLMVKGDLVQHVLAYRAPFFDADGRQAGQVAALLDITPLKAAEEALKRSEALFNTIHQCVVDLIAIIDDQGRRIYTSPSYQFVLGYSDAEMQQLSSTDLLHPDDLERVSEALRLLLEGQAMHWLEYRLRHKQGRWLHFESTATIIPDEGYGGARALVVARNITERKESDQRRLAMEVQLRQAQKLEAIGQLAAGIAHEINTPTQYIGDNATFLKDSFNETFALMDRLMAHLGEIEALGGPAGDLAKTALATFVTTDLAFLGEEIPKAIQQSLEGVGRISKIVKAMKDFSHPGGESKTLTDLHRAIDSTVTVSRNEWKYVAQVVTEFDPAMPLVPCFPGEFNQVLLNLIVNAAHAIEAARGGKDTGSLGQIRIATRVTPTEAVVSVIDDGAGMPPGVQARMFDPFFTTKPVGKGTGQGLSIAHSVIVEKHQGRIEVTSEVGRGTTFSLHLPLQDLKEAGT